MNSVQIIGRITKDLELKYTQSGKAVVKFSLAVNRTYNREETDYLIVVAWGKTAENLCNYMGKGSQIGVVGRIQTGSYEKDGRKVYTTEIIANEVEFLDSRNKSGEGSGNKAGGPKPKEEDTDLSEFEMIDDDEDIPF